MFEPMTRVIPDPALAATVRYAKLVAYLVKWWSSTGGL